MTGARERGFTLIELMISLVIFSLAVAGVLSVAASMAQSFRERRMLIESEDNVRGAMDFVSDAIRGASPAIQQTGTIRDDLTCTTLTGGGISLTNSTSGPDSVTVVFASGGVVTSTRTTYSKGNTSITLTDATNISVGDQLLITDLANGEIVTVNSITGSNIGVTASTCAAFTGSYAALSLVIRVVRAKFFVDTNDTYGFGSNVLLMDPDDDGTATPEPLAENVEDMQIALGLDSTNTYSSVDTWEYSSSTGAATGSLRAARITFVTKNTEALPGTATPFRRPAVEDHPQATAADAYPRRVLSSTVEFRNLKGSP
jgi:prepilin-type N-terminal cleavage/methylation domain-containing protein